MQAISSLRLAGILRSPRVAVGVLVVLHLIGAVGLAFSSARGFFLAGTPYTLIITCALVALHHPGRLPWGWCAAAFLIGFCVEAVGVATGLPFGHYTYGPALGIALFNVPLLVGLNWVLVTYLACQAAPASGRVATALSAALLLTGYDALLEPAAQSLGYWHWANGQVDPLNYIGWFGTGLSICLLYPTSKPGGNPLVYPVLVIQVVFFVWVTLVL